MSDRGVIQNPYSKGKWLFLSKCLGFVKLFYPKSNGISSLYLAYFFIPQKVFRINGGVPWPVHFTSRVLQYKNVSCGANSAPGMNSGCYIQARNGIEIGKNLRMGPNVGLISSNHSLSDYDTWDVAPPITLGDNVWLGMGVVVLPGVSIGSNVVIGSNSVVSKDIPSNSIAVGSPCKIVKEKPPYNGYEY